MGNVGIFKGVAGEWRYGQGGRCLKKFDDPWFKGSIEFVYRLLGVDSKDAAIWSMKSSWTITVGWHGYHTDCVGDRLMWVVAKHWAGPPIQWELQYSPRVTSLESPAK